MEMPFGWEKQIHSKYNDWIDHCVNSIHRASFVLVHNLKFLASNLPVIGKMYMWAFATS